MIEMQIATVFGALMVSFAISWILWFRIRWYYGWSIGIGVVLFIFSMWQIPVCACEMYNICGYFPWVK